MEVAQYESDASDGEIIQEQRAVKEKKRRRGKKKTKFWIIEETFDNAGEVEASIKNEWTKHYTNHTQDVIGQSIVIRHQ
ncbi:unnamed protein product [Adineta steineri]|uniref:Uncharacterized protein n=1 Tax=Adineta steineri TaxID=433720 RepID=A0A815SFW6_9BILA|nr:unnamed protein product [Adineta steineri]CAF1582038.1 unnamed protein product [Adineta steineri]CAF1674435.1 unnamed protein product [Adineta steineri]CAF3808879.1 unnamed protein product [Adineta steineri]